MEMQVFESTVNPGEIVVAFYDTGVDFSVRLPVHKASQLIVLLTGKVAEIAQKAEDRPRAATVKDLAKDLARTVLEAKP